MNFAAKKFTCYMYIFLLYRDLSVSCHHWFTLWYLVFSFNKYIFLICIAVALHKKVVPHTWSQNRRNTHRSLWWRIWNRQENGQDWFSGLYCQYNTEVWLNLQELNDKLNSTQLHKYWSAPTLWEVLQQSQNPGFQFISEDNVLCCSKIVSHVTHDFSYGIGLKFHVKLYDIHL